MCLASFGPVFVTCFPQAIKKKNSIQIQLLELIKHERKRKNNVPMAQTMPDASFRPVVCCSHSNVMYFVNDTLHILQIFS